MSDLLGLNLEPRNLGILQVCLRGVIVFLVALVIVRLAHKRFMAKMSAFDVILGFVLASMLARAINGSAAFLPTLAGGFVLVLLHRFLGALSFRSDAFGRLVKGQPQIVVEDGQPIPKALRDQKISESDLLEELHLNGNLDSVHQVKRAIIERNGQISVVPYEKKQAPESSLEAASAPKTGA